MEFAHYLIKNPANDPNITTTIWKALDKGGVLKLKYTDGSEVVLKL